MSWLSFPQEVEDMMSNTLVPYGYNCDSFPDTTEFFFQIENVCRNSPAGVPWVTIFFPEEYPLADHFLLTRPNRDVKFSSYSILHPLGKYDAKVVCAPPLSIIFVYSKSALIGAAATKSLLFEDAWTLLKDKDGGNWVVIADPLDPAWVHEKSKERVL